MKNQVRIWLNQRKLNIKNDPVNVEEDYKESHWFAIDKMRKRRRGANVFLYIFINNFFITMKKKSNLNPR